MICLKSALDGWLFSATPWLLCLWEIDPVPLVQEAVWALGPVRIVAENLSPTGI